MYFYCLNMCFCAGTRYIELFLHSTEEAGGPVAGGAMKYGQPPAQQGWGDNRQQVNENSFVRRWGKALESVKDHSEGERE